MGCGNSKGSTAVENQTGSTANTNNHQTGEQPGKNMNGPDKTTQDTQDSNKQHIEDQQNTDSSPKEEIVENGEEKKDAEKPDTQTVSEDRTTGEETPPEQTPEQEESKPVTNPTEEETPETQAPEEVTQPEVVKEEEEITRAEEFPKAEEDTKTGEVAQAEEVTQAEEVAPAEQEVAEVPQAEEDKPIEPVAPESTEEITGKEGENTAAEESQEDGDSAVDMEIQAVDLEAEAEEEEANTVPISELPKPDEQSAVNEPNVPSNDDKPSSPVAPETGEHLDQVPALNNQSLDNETAMEDGAQAQSGEQMTTIEEVAATGENTESQAETGESEAVAAVPEATLVEDMRGSPAKDAGETEGEGEQAKSDDDQQATGEQSAE